MVMGGGLGLGPIVEAVSSLDRLEKDTLEVTVVCGSNHTLQHQLSMRFPRFRILGQTDQVPALMAQADLLLTKPGGLTCSEAMASGLPMLLLEPLPGHEEENAEFLCGAGVAKTVGPAEVGNAVTELLFKAPDRLSFMRERRAEPASRMQRVQLPPPSSTTSPADGFPQFDKQRRHGPCKK